MYVSRAKGNYRPGSDIDLALKGEGLGLSMLKEGKWPERIVVECKRIVRGIRGIKSNLGIKARGRMVKESGEGIQLREVVDSYNANFDGKNGDIGLGNGYLWNYNVDISG